LATPAILTDAKLFKLKDGQWLNTCPDVAGIIDGVEVSSNYNGYSLTTKNGTDINVRPDSKINLKLYV